MKNSKSSEYLSEIPGIHTEKGIENSGSPALFAELLGEVYELIDAKCDSIRTRLEKDDIVGYTTEVHALKTTCRMIGAMELAEDFYTLEKLGTDHDVTKLQEQTPGVLAGFTALKPYLEPYAAKKAEPDKDYDRDAIRAILDELTSAIADFDLTLAEDCTTRLASFRFEEPLAPEIQKLCELVSNLDYEESKERIETIQKMLG